jgi:hypothetical protein
MMKFFALLLFCLSSVAAQPFTFADIAFLSQQPPTVSVTVTGKLILDISGTAPWDVEIDNPSGSFQVQGNELCPSNGYYTLCILTNSGVEDFTLNGESNIVKLVCENNPVVSLFLFQCPDTARGFTNLPNFRSNTNLPAVALQGFNFPPDTLLPLMPTNLAASVSIYNCNTNSGNTLDFSVYPLMSGMTCSGCNVDAFTNIAASYPPNYYDFSGNSTIPQADVDAFADALIAGDEEQPAGSRVFCISGDITEAKGDALVALGWTVEADNYYGEPE